MAFYDDMSVVATELLTEFGKVVTFERVSATFDPVTGIDSTRTVTTYQTVAVEVPIRDALVDGTRIVVGDRFLIIDASTAPCMGDKLRNTAVCSVIPTTELLSIVAIEPINPGGTPIAYRLQVRA